MIKYFLIGIALTVIIVGARFFVQPSASNMPLQKDGEIVEASAETELVTRGEVAQPDYSTDNNVAQGTTLQNALAKQQELPSLKENTLWSESDNQDDIPERFLNKGLNPQVLNISHKTIHNLKIGDEISLSIPQLAQAYSMDIEQVRNHGNGGRTVLGHLKNTDLPYSVIITSGSQASFATINTPDGSYVMEAEGDSGWIMSIASLDYLIDTSLEDYQIPNFNR